MTKLTEKHFKIFQQECERWLEKLKLDNWEVNFGWDEDKNDNSRASCSSELSNYITTIFLNRVWNYEPQIVELLRVAKHEVIHLLLARFSGNARARYLSIDDLDESEEELVRKLEKLL